MLFSDTMHLMRVIHFACRLPIAFYQNGEMAFSLPESIQSAAQLLENKSPLSLLSISAHQPLVVQYVEDAYQEQYLYFELGRNAALLLGPFTTIPLTEGEIARRIRFLHLPLERRSEVAQHYQALPYIGEDSYFYIGRLLEQLFPGEEPLPMLPPPIQTDMNRPYFEKTYENRMALFQHPPYFLEQEEVRMIRNGDKNNALKVLSEINSLKRATLAQDPLRSLKNSLICSCTLFTRAAISAAVPADEAFTLSDAFILQIERLQDMKALDALESTMMLQFIDHVNRHKSAQLSSTIRRAVTYIDDHLSEKLTLPLIARQVYIHPDYLSSRFKQEMSISLTSFIQKRRIEEACHFLRYSQSSVSDIAGFYQFCSQSHFIQIFKKHIGMTPAQYRNMQ